MEFITEADNTDNILTWRESDIEAANDYLLSLARKYGLTDELILIPPRSGIKRLGVAVACRECAASMVGSDATVSVNGRSEDIYLQKYNLYRSMVKDLASNLGFEDFAVENTSAEGKGGVGIIRVSRG